MYSIDNVDKNIHIYIYIYVLDYILVDSVQGFNILNISLTISPQVVTFLGGAPLWDFTTPAATSPFTQGGSVVAPPRRVQTPMPAQPLRMRESILLVSGDGHHLTRRSQSMQRFHAEIFTTLGALGQIFFDEAFGAFGSLGLEERIDDSGSRKQAWDGMGKLGKWVLWVFKQCVKRSYTIITIIMILLILRSPLEFPLQNHLTLVGQTIGIL